MSKHTPGPWRASWLERNKRCKTGDWAFFGEQLGSLVRLRDCAEKNQEAKANAHLIAAAPDLLAACEAVVKTLTDSHELIWQQCVAAIAKARGENGGGK